MEVLAPDVVAIANGSGVAPALRAPGTGVEKPEALFSRLRHARSFRATTVWINGTPSIRIDYDGGSAAMALLVEDGSITRIFAINNPFKLSGMERDFELRRGRLSTTDDVLPFLTADSTGRTLAVR